MIKFLALLTGMMLHALTYGQTANTVLHSSSYINNYFAPGDSIQYTSLKTCEQNVKLTAIVAGANPRYQWLKDNLPLSGKTSREFIAEVSGRYSVEIEVGGKKDTLDHVDVKISEIPDADFTFSADGLCSNTPVRFTNTSKGTGLTYKWDFGDPESGTNNSTSTINPTHEFIGKTGNGNQSFNVKLIAISSDGCTDTVIQKVTTKQLPETGLGGTGSTKYNGKSFFTVCTSTASTFDFFNESKTPTTNTDYRIIWGDGSADFTSTKFEEIITHNYPVGIKEIKFVVSGSNGCKDTGLYNVFVGSNPAVGLGNPGNTNVCTGSPLTFPITGTDNNPPGTTYTLSFNDGSESITYNHPAPTSATHVFKNPSCGTSSSNGGIDYPNSFYASVFASNPCSKSSASVVPIYVSSKPSSAFSIGPNDTVCVGITTRISNTSPTASIVTSNGVCTNGKIVWIITPSTGYTIVNGSLGNDRGSDNQNQWTAGSDILDLNFTTPGTYTIKLRVGGSELCGSSDIIKTICVNPKPTAGFTLDQNIGCGPLTVKPTNNSNTPLCGQNNYLWSVTYAPAQGCTPEIAKYSFVGGTSANSKDPQILFENPGIYSIKLRTNGLGTNCFAESATQTITVKAKPVLALNTFPLEICQNGSISPTALLNCFPSNPADYKWEFQNGTPLTSTLPNPGSILFNTAGQSIIKLSSTNECGTTSVQRTITIKPTPAVNVPADIQLCAGTPTGNINFTSNPGGGIFNWTNSDPSIGLAATGTNNIPSFNAINNTATQKVVTITVAATLNGCRGVESSFKITIDPKPAAPVAQQLLTYCIGSEAVPLTATASNGNTLVWYNNKELNNPLTVAPTPVTTAQGSFKYYVVQQGTGGCKSDAVEITVNVNAGINGNKIGNNQTICGGNRPAILSAIETLNGGAPPYTYQWSSSTDGVTWTDIAGATDASFAPPVLNADIKYKRKVSGGQCISESNIVEIKVLGSLTNFNISEAQVICANEIPATLTGQIPVGGNGNYNYQWELSTDGNTWTAITGATNKDYSPAALTTTTNYRRKVSSGECSVYSNEVRITVNPIPVVSQLPDIIVCNNSSVPSANLVSNPSNNISYSWTNDNASIGLATSGNGMIPAFTAANNLKKPSAGNISVIPTYTANGKACIGPSMNYDVTVLPHITLSPVNDTAVCSGAFIPAFTPIHDAEIFSEASLKFRYAVSGTGSTLNNGSGSNIPSFTVNNPGNTDLIVTITVTPEYEFNGIKCDGTARNYKVTIKPGTPEGTGGPDAELCAATSYTMKALSSSGTIGEWKQVSGPSTTIVSPNSATSVINGLKGGNVYKFVWTVNGFATCPPTIDTVAIDNKAELINSITSTPVVICAGQPVSITGDLPTGGKNIYTYQWQQSTDDTIYSDIPGANTKDLLFSPSQSVYVRRIVNSSPCANNSNAVQVTVQAALSNNTISDNRDVCINTDAGLITGSLPSGGNGNYIFEWQSSIDNGANWITITAANAKDYSPGILTQTTSFRRTISTALCTGPQASVSNIVTVTIRPDAIAEFNPTQTDACPPFVINSNVIGLKTYPEINSGYRWFIDGVAAGSGINFPGYTMLNSDDTVTIKLVTLSNFGCKPDSVSRQFITYKVPEPSFILSDTVGCGPLSVSINNTTLQQGLFTYVWEFGNGQTSSSSNPGTIVFNPNPNSGDTVYHVTLKAISKCDTVSISKAIRVKSKPKSLFAPSKSVGCSPMTVSFNNISRGLGVNYVIDYGDGTRKQLTDENIPEHTFNVSTRDTFYVKLIAVNECGSDSSSYSIIVSPNTIKLDVAVNGNEINGCVPNTVRFINNSRGASSFVYNFGDGNTYASSKNVDTVTHRYDFPGTFTVRIRATNGCSDTSTYETITVFPKPNAAFNLDKLVICANDSISATNLSDSANSYAWSFGNGNVSNKVNPVFTYDQSGEYIVTLKAYRVNGFGNVCVDSTSRKVSVESPYGRINYTSGTLCNDLAARFEADVNFTDSLIWNFGDGTILRTKERIVFHRYLFSGSFVPTVTLISKAGCSSILKGTDTIRVDKIKSGFVTQVIQDCGLTTVYFTDTSRSSSGIKSSNWLTGDGVSLTGKTISKSFTVTSDYTVRLIAESVLGCYDTTFKTISVPVFSVPKAQITGQTEICSNEDLKLSANVQSGDAIQSYLWMFSNGATFSEKDLQTKLNPGNYSVELIVRTINDCADTTSTNITIKKAPDVSISNDVTICKGGNTLLQATGGITYSWSPDNDISCTDCNIVMVNPDESRTYQVIGKNEIGCADTASTYVTVIQPFRMNITGRDSICIGQSTQMLVTGGVTYSWSPNVSISDPNSGNPVFNPSVTTVYRVIGYDGKNCFTDTAFVTVAVGGYPTVDLGPDQVLPTGTLYPLKSTITNGPISKWEWTPNRNLDCNDCAEPVATVKTNTSYTVKVTSAYGCSATDTIAIKAFCVNTQVYIPNAFTPDGDGLNDKLIVRGSGIQTVKYFRIFNRWGELVFERSNFAPNDPSFGWDGKVRGNNVKPDVYVFTAEVLCDDGSPYVYKGNVSLIK